MESPGSAHAFLDFLDFLSIIAKVPGKRTMVEAWQYERMINVQLYKFAQVLPI